ncbi:MAG: acetyl-CoA decarbonylase/synthase complex subunit delta [Candidatus Omnitrophota bacterium]
MIFETIIGSIKVGGESVLPFLIQEGKVPNKPVIAFEVWDMPPYDFPQSLSEPFGNALNNPLDWALKCVNDYGAKLLCIKLQSINPDTLDKNSKEAVKFINNLIKAVDVPLIIQGSGNKEKDNLVLPEIASIAKGKKYLIGSATQDNYKILAKTCIDNNHSIIAESPIDINIAKQLNILLSDAGVEPSRIVINPTVGSLGYGLEYAYSIMERARLAALAGDTMLAQSFICFAGQEAWRAKEAKAKMSEMPAWGDEKKRGLLWEIITAISFLQSGADILVMRHPKAIKAVENYLNDLLP